MNVASTVEIASVVDPNTSPSSRVHRLSRINPDDPDRKKQASRTARIGERTLYDRRRAAGYSRTAGPGPADEPRRRACPSKYWYRSAANALIRAAGRFSISSSETR